MLRTGLAFLVVALVLMCGAAPVFAHEVIYDFPLNSDPGWTIVGAWSYGHAADGTSNIQVTAPHSGTDWYSHKPESSPGALDGKYDSDMSSADTLTTTAIDCTGLHSVRLRFWRRLGMAEGDVAAVRVSNNGADWTTVWQFGGDFMADTVWAQVEYDISAVADDQPTVYIQWALGPTDADCQCWGWDIDDVQIVVDPTPDLVYSFPLTTDSGWTRQGLWAFGAPTGDGAGDPSEGHTGTNVFGYGLSGNYVDSTAAQSLTTGALDCSNVTHTTLRFWRQLTVQAPAYDHTTVEVSTDGSTWTQVWENPGWVWDGQWEQCSYDISAMADGHPTVYIRWVMGPTNASGNYGGWNIDDVEIWGSSTAPPLQILAWVPYTDATREYPNTVAALAGIGPFAITESYTLDAAVLAEELKGKQVFLVPEPEAADTADLTAAGEAFADVLQDFTYNGGTVVVCGEYDDITNHTGFMTATGLMTADFASVTGGGASLTTVLPGQPISLSLPATFTGSDATARYVIGPESTAVVEDGSGNAVFAYRDYGYGAAVMVGFDYFAYDANAQQVLINAVRYPRWNREALLYREGAHTDNSLEALNRLHVHYRLGCGTGDMDCAFTYPSYWDPLVYDSPNYYVYTHGSGLTDYVADGGEALLSTWNLTSESDVAAAFGVTPVEHLYSNPAVHRWEPADPVFTDPASVPDLLTWSDDWPANGDRLSVADPEGVALAGLTASATADQAAIVMANDGRTIVNGFLWDEQSGDSDGDGIEDVVELIMNEVTALARRPEADFDASWPVTTGPLTVTFTDLSQGVVESWYWDFGDGTTSTDQNPVHVYTSSGLYSVSLVASNAYNHDTETKVDLVPVTVAPVAEFEGTPTAGALPLEVSFTDLSTNIPTEWEWNFGDLSTATAQNPTHTYTDAGSYPVSLTASNAAGSNTKIKTDYISAAPPVAATFSASTTAGVVPLAVTFTDHSTGSPTEWEWDFGDGDTSTEQSPSHTYTDPGYYTVTLTASNGVVADVETRTGCIAAGFTDTPADNWAFYHILACATAEVVQGYTDNSYQPLNPVNRGQMAAYIARALAGGDEAVPVPSVAEPSFTDVGTDHWAYRYVEYVREQNVVQGYTDGSYQPDVVVNRGQMAVYIARAVVDPAERPDLPSYTAPAEASFPDVTPENEWSWCYKYVEYIRTLDPPVTTGYTDGMYHPERQVTRDQMAVYVQRAFDLPIYVPSP